MGFGSFKIARAFDVLYQIKNKFGGTGYQLLGRYEYSYSTTGLK